MNRDIDLGVVYQGATADFQFFLFENGRPMPEHTGDEVSIGFLLNGTSNPLITRKLSDGNISRSKGTVLTSLSEVETEALVPGKYQVVVVFTSGTSGKEDEIFRGDFKVVESMA